MNRRPLSSALLHAAGIAGVVALAMGFAVSGAAGASTSCAPSDSQGWVTTGPLHLFAPASTHLSRGLFSVVTCTDRNARSTVVLRRAEEMRILASRPVHLRTGHRTAILLKPPGAGRYRVTVGVGGGLNASVVVRVLPGL